LRDVRTAHSSNERRTVAVRVEAREGLAARLEQLLEGDRAVLVLVRSVEAFLLLGALVGRGRRRWAVLGVAASAAAFILSGGELGATTSGVASDVSL
jgi:hypothetical protein